MRAIRTAGLIALIGSFLIGEEAAAQNTAIENILVSKRNGLTNIQIWPACRMRYVEHSPGPAGIELRILVTTDGDCQAQLERVRREVYLPMGRRLGKVSDVIFEDQGDGQSFITLRFDEPQQFSVKQHAVGWIEVFVDTTVASADLPAAVPDPVVPPAAVVTPPAASREERVRDRDLSPSVRLEPTKSNDKYVVQLGVFSDISVALAEVDRLGGAQLLYTTDFVLNGARWQGLQMGFYASEADAEQALRGISGSFPDAWVRLVSSAEASVANAHAVRSSFAKNPLSVRMAAVETVSPDQELLLMEQGRRALLERRYGDAIESYSRVAQNPTSDNRLQAREYLAVALERSGEPRRAIAEYEAYLAETSPGADADRVAGRLRGLSSALEPSEPVLVAGSAPSDRSGWQIYGGVSQYYWRNEEQLVHDGNQLLTSSGVLALADVTALRRGDRFDIFSRINGAYQLNLVEFDDDGDVGWISDAYIDVRDHRLGLSTRVGRQTRRSDGVLTRFDGVGLRYEWRPDISVSVSAGLPIDSPRFTSGGDRFFYALSSQIEDLWDRLSVNVYTQHQTADGIDDRRAVGGEVQYRDGRLNVVGLVDYDVSFAELNTALINTTWAMENGWRWSATARTGMQPFLTTRNALAGQPVTSIAALQTTFTEGQIRTLARHRTAATNSFSAGLRLPLTERLDLSLDVTTREADATVASAGVAALPATGQQVFYNASVIGSSLLRDGDLTMLTLRYNTTQTRNLATLIMDARLPFSEGLRINPRISLTTLSDNRTGVDQLIARPSLRVIYRWRALMIDLEAGGRWSSRELPATELDPFTSDGTEELLGGYLNLGYRWEF
ncbi:MAG: SPOR domain-containing protein [Pseudomonadota bacterium]